MSRTVSYQDNVKAWGQVSKGKERFQVAKVKRKSRAHKWVGRYLSIRAWTKPWQSQGQASDKALAKQRASQ